MKTISIVIPSFNEDKFILDLIKKIRDIDLNKLNFEAEIIVVDDGSTDNTRLIMENLEGIKYFYQENQGKGAAVQLGIKEATGDYILVQDADLEYSPADYLPMLEVIQSMKFIDNIAVYGSRTMVKVGSRKFIRPYPLKNQSLSPWIMNQLLTLMVIVFYGRYITDTLTGYKVYPTSFFKGIEVHSKGFEADHEITAKLIKKNYRIIEVPISYEPRSKAEGKKINFFDGIKAIVTLITYRLKNG
jgi:dolichol-phosphate mannosyltransferase